MPWESSRCTISSLPELLATLMSADQPSVWRHARSMRCEWKRKEEVEKEEDDDEKEEEEENNDEKEREKRRKAEEKKEEGQKPQINTMAMAQALMYNEFFYIVLSFAQFVFQPSRWALTFAPFARSWRTNGALPW